MTDPAFASAPFAVGRSPASTATPAIPAEESLCPVVSHDWVNAEYKHLIVKASPQGARGQARPVLQPPLPVAR